ncbi:MAG: hypothetical protein AB7F43_09430 [Bacteriovoracia bacterium]
MVLDCPRCGSSGFESLRSHSYCAECNYSPADEEASMIPDWALEALDEESVLGAFKLNLANVH